MQFSNTSLTRYGQSTDKPCHDRIRQATARGRRFCKRLYDFRTKLRIQVRVLKQRCGRYLWRDAWRRKIFVWVYRARKPGVCAVFGKFSRSSLLPHGLLSWAALLIVTLDPQFGVPLLRPDRPRPPRLSHPSTARSVTVLACHTCDVQQKLRR